MIGSTAPVLKRIYAGIIDYSIAWIIFVLYMVYFGDWNDSTGYELEGAMAIPIVAYWCFYFPIIESICGQTFGKYMFDIEVVNYKGYKPSLNESFKRRIFDFIEIIPLCVIGIISIISNNFNQRLGDRYANCHVIEAPDAACL